MAVTPLPEPQVTLPNWGQQLNDGIESRYQDALLQTSNEATTRGNADADLQNQIDSLVVGEAGQELASAEVAYSFPTTFAVSPATAAAVVGAMIIVPPTEGPVRLEWGGDAAVGTSGKALLQLQVWEGVGSFTVPVWTSAPLTSDMVTSFSGNAIPLRGSARLDPSTVDRTFFLAAIMFRDAASTPTASMKNIPGNPTYLRAVAA